MSDKIDSSHQGLKIFINSASKQILTYVPLFAGLGILVLSPVGGSIVLSLSFFIAGFTGMIVILRREIPVFFYTITGRKAVIEGAIFVACCWVFAIYTLLS